MFVGIVYSFNIQCSDGMRKIAKEKSVAMEEHNVIYRLFEDIKTRLTQRLPPVFEENVLGLYIFILFILFSNNLIQFILISG